MKYVKCALCGKEIIQSRIDLWCYHISFPGTGVVCIHHHGVEEEYAKLLEQASKELETENE